MGLREWVGRIAHLTRAGIDVAFDGNRRLHARRWPIVASLPDDAIPASVLSRERADLVRELLPDDAEAIVAASKRVLAGEFSLLGYEPTTLQRPLRYDFDPFTGGTWSDRHGLLLDYRTAAVGDPKWIWELNRLQHVPLLLAAWLISHDERFRTAAIKDLEAWLSQTRPGFGIAWNNGFEAGMRAISLALCVDALREAGPACIELRRRIAVLLAHHVRWIRRYPSRYSSANNHRLGELVGIIAASSLVPELRLESAAAAALSELELRCREQFGPDGGHVEQAFGYAVFASDLLVVGAGSLNATGREVPGWLGEALRRSADALALQLGFDDPEPRYGDCDDGRATVLDGQSTRTGRAVCASLAAWLGHPGARTAARALDPTALWFFGREGVTRFEKAARSESASNGWLPELGLIVLREGATTVTFDIGALGWGPLAAHGHADALQVTLAHGGDILVGDPGTGSYFGSNLVRNAFRGTGFHATVLVDDLDQAEIAGPFLWRRAPRVEALEGDVERRVASGRHDGYARLAAPVSHTRTVALLEDGLVLVRDVLESRGRHRYSQRWPFPPGTVIEQVDEDTLRVTRPTCSLLMQVVCSETATLSVTTGSTQPFAGWWSDGLEAIKPAPIVWIDAVASGAIEFATVLSVGGSAALDRPADHSLLLTRGGVEHAVLMGIGG